VGVYQRLKQRVVARGAVVPGGENTEIRAIAFGYRSLGLRRELLHDSKRRQDERNGADLGDDGGVAAWR
jgi:hypothetical protein